MYCHEILCNDPIKVNNVIWLVQRIVMSTMHSSNCRCYRIVEFLIRISMPICFPHIQKSGLEKRPLTTPRININIMLQLHRSDHQFHCLLGCVLYKRSDADLNPPQTEASVSGISCQCLIFVDMTLSQVQQNLEWANYEMVFRINVKIGNKAHTLILVYHKDNATILSHTIQGRVAIILSGSTLSYRLTALIDRWPNLHI